MAELITITETPIITPKMIKATAIAITIEWQTKADGSLTSAAIASTIAKNLPGRVCTFGFTAPGTTNPTDNYDITITDEFGVDIFGGALTNRSATLTQQAVPLIAPSTYGPRLITSADLTFNLSGNIVNTAQGTCVLCFEYRG